MSHSHDLPNALDFDALRTLVDWARGKIPFSQEVLASGWCIVGYAMRQLAPAPRLVGSPADPRPVESVAIDTLEQLASEQPISQGLIPWALLIEWLIAKLIESKLKG
jgi:hypothetical protein